MGQWKWCWKDIVLRGFLMKLSPRIAWKSPENLVCTKCLYQVAEFKFSVTDSKQSHVPKPHNGWEAELRQYCRLLWAHPVILPPLCSHLRQAPDRCQGCAESSQHALSSGCTWLSCDSQGHCPHCRVLANLREVFWPPSVAHRGRWPWTNAACNAGSWNKADLGLNPGSSTNLGCGIAKA